MKNKKSLLIVFFCAFSSLQILAQDKYVYQVDLTQVEEDKLKVHLNVPKINKASVVFHFPKIIPGTYRVSDYGKFINDVKAYDKAGKRLPVKKISDNSWQIKEASRMSTIEYTVEDTWDATIENDVFSMAGTNIEAGKNFVINTPGFFGYFEEMKGLAFELRFKKPSDFYAATPLKPRTSTADEDVFDLDNADHLYDSPIMFSVPDTTTVHIGNTEVLIAVYSPKKMIQSKFIAQLMSNVLNASSKYLGGRLPVEKYAFIYYFNGEQRPFTVPGALEHNYSSFYSLPEAPQQALAPTLMDIGAHEFFHVVTPLTIQSKEVKEFDFTKPVLSRHLWLYEGSTEYASDHVQVKYGLNTVNQFLDKLSQKIKTSKQKYSDNLPFTELSKESAGKHREQYGNVYEKGALIAACLDLYLLHLSEGSYDLVKLKHDLSVRFGKRTAFTDNTLFDVITEMTYPEIRSFFAKYVEGNEAIPYEYFFGLAGIKYMPSNVRNDFSMGNVSIGATQEGKVVVFDISKINDFGMKLGYKKGDEVLSINGASVNPSNLESMISTTKSRMKEGVPVALTIIRKNAEGARDTLSLSAPAERIAIKEEHKLSMMTDVSMAQATIRKAWLASEDRGVPLQGERKDVAEIDDVIKALYEVISGPAGKRNWERFRSLFTANAFMGATAPAAGGNKFVTFSPEEYLRKNDNLFMKESFMEKEIARKVNQFGSIAQVFTSYEFDLGNGKMKQRGINSVQLVKEQGRWWIAAIIWQDESANLPIPKQYLEN